MTHLVQRAMTSNEGTKCVIHADKSRLDVGLMVSILTLSSDEKSFLFLLNLEKVLLSKSGKGVGICRQNRIQSIHF